MIVGKHFLFKWGYGLEKSRQTIKLIGYTHESHVNKYYDGTTISHYHYIVIFGLGFGVVFEK